MISSVSTINNAHFSKIAFVKYFIYKIDSFLGKMDKTNVFHTSSCVPC